ncbi:MBL fold metallo-hydrolase [Brevibacillus sp. SYSU BS000544]|uniref:MBL fold metallo-hydrolase n=1 Tax=Brevibacillus sp. SYSU BS000544 TaxID=3416443 RepID=UPI003CE4C030
MFVQRLNWAGVLVRYNQTTIVIDPLYYVNEGFFGKTHETFHSLDEFGPVDAVLVTHVHSDHFDHKAIVTFYGKHTPVFLPSESAEAAKSTELTNVTGVAKHQSIEIGDLTITATYAVDGLGDPQISWIVQAGEAKLIHTGDTLWHGYWWKIAEEYGPIDIACLPVNAAMIQEEGVIPSHQPICLTPEQAVAAGAILKAKWLLPIHYGAFHNPPGYQQTPDILTRLTASAKERDLSLLLLKSSESFEIASCCQ